MLPEWLDVVQRDFNHPSVIGWCPLNETQNHTPPALVPAVYWATKHLDPTRPAIDTSGYVHAITDVDDCHTYEQDPGKFAALFAPFSRGGEPQLRADARSVSHTRQRVRRHLVNSATGDEAWGMATAEDRRGVPARYRPHGSAPFHPKMPVLLYPALRYRAGSEWPLHLRSVARFSPFGHSLSTLEGRDRRRSCRTGL
jgi:hypothetical protein